jgi:hypothetical protein
MKIYPKSLQPKRSFVKSIPGDVEEVIDFNRSRKNGEQADKMTRWALTAE